MLRVCQLVELFFIDCRAQITPVVQHDHFVTLFDRRTETVGDEVDRVRAAAGEDAEILRGAIQAIPPGEIEAARALGMSRAKALFYIILPRAARIGLPAYSNEVILMLKASALASTVTLLELTGMARTIIARTYLPVEIFFAAGVFYLVISFVLVQGFKLLERWLRVDACQGR